MEYRYCQKFHEKQREKKPQSKEDKWLSFDNTGIPLRRCNEMNLYNGGTTVARGVYWNPLDGQGISIKGRGILPGDATRRYLKISPIWLLILGPLCGTAFVLFLPMFGIGVFLLLCAIPFIKASFEIIGSAVRVCSGFRHIRIIHQWGFSGRTSRLKGRKPQNSEKK